MGIFIGSVAAALIVSFLCSLSEATLLSLTPGEVAELDQKHPRLGKIWRKFKSTIDRPIIVVLVFNTAAHTVGATIAGAEFEKIWHGKGIFWFSLSFTLAILIFTEILPKTLGVDHRRRLALLIADPLDLLAHVVYPFIWIARLMSRPLSRYKKTTKSMALDELRALAAYARLSKEIGPYQEKIIREASQLSEKAAGEIMIPANEIIYFDNDKSLEDLITKAHLDPHTRFPVRANHNIDEILGYINFKELLFLAKNNPNVPSLEGIIRPIRFVSAETPLHKLLRTCIEEHIHIAIVQNDAGKTLGLVTLEDIIEEFLGEIEDEFDRLPKMAHSLSGGTWMVGGGVYWVQLSRMLGKSLEPFSGTLSEWLLEKSNKPLKPGDCITVGDLDFIIRRVRRGKVFEVTLLPHGTTPPPHLPKPSFEDPAHHG
jgi:CBS domain containing-hemolysin-like protein